MCFVFQQRNAADKDLVREGLLDNTMLTYCRLTDRHTDIRDETVWTFHTTIIVVIYTYTYTAYVWYMYDIMCQYISPPKKQHNKHHNKRGRMLQSAHQEHTGTGTQLPGSNGTANSNTKLTAKQEREPLQQNRTPGQTGYRGVPRVWGNQGPWWQC